MSWRYSSDHPDAAALIIQLVDLTIGATARATVSGTLFSRSQVFAWPRHRRQRLSKLQSSKMSVSWTFPDLTPTLRGHAVTEVQQDIARNILYPSKRAKTGTNVIYQNMLLSALQNGTPETFAEDIWTAGILEPNKDGTPHANAHETLAGGEWVRYYLRGLCLVAAAGNVSELEIYRAKAVAEPRPDSQARIGQRIRASTLLADLRTNIGVGAALGVPAGPNSGLCARLPNP